MASERPAGDLTGRTGACWPRPCQPRDLPLKLPANLFVPILPGATLFDRLLCSGGALLGIGLTALIGYLTFGRDAALPFLVAPVGASAVLVFAVPSSPLAQPWPVVGGNTLGALIGIAASSLIADPLLASGVAVSFAIIGMSLARCLHPPGGAAALVAVLGGPSVTAAGLKFAFLPVAVNSAALVLFAWLFHKASRHRYPHWHVKKPDNPHGTRDPLPETRVGFNSRDVDAALAEIGETFDIDREDLDTLLRRIELRAVARQHGDPLCRDVMSRDLVTIDERADIATAQSLMLAHAIRTLPVVDSNGRLTGIVGLREIRQDVAHVWEAILSAATSKEDARAFDLVPVLSDGKRHAVVVVDGEHRPIGMITQTDLLAALVHRPSAPLSRM
jgi:CBS domain-containing membrane protein